MTIRVESGTDASAVLERAGDFLGRRPVANNLILTILHARRVLPEPGRYWVAWDGEGVVGVAMQSPPDFPAVLTTMPDAAVSAIASAVAAEGVLLPGVNADATTASRFAGEWTELQPTGATPYNGLRIYELTELSSPRVASGVLRPAGEEDEDLVLKWMQAFSEEAGEPSMAVEVARRRLRARQLWVWDDAGPVSLAGHTLPVHDVVRVGPVYTPVDLRNRGYASACVCALSRHLVDHGLRCILYADLANPVSNSIYRRMGYRAVVEILRYRFG